MAFITKDELKTHLYGEQVETIDRGDDTLAVSAISGAVKQAKSYLKQYDTDAIFSATGDNRDELLLIFIKDIAVWHFINLGNPATDLELREKRYNAAIAWLKDVQSGNVSADLPERGITAETPGDIIYGSNPKRTQHF